ncbi:unnamed protein product [Oikopleura dioica]|uniref:Small RNA 2'-O-methyltransferase n=1 Tax=Oikopleura dioica TaxID=34765 RepID=E4WVY2_OIKDI|nr:unnamed protein product [Oikopleura dioica]
MAAAREEDENWSQNSRIDDFEHERSAERNIPEREEEKETIEHDVPQNGNITYFEPKLYLQRYDYVLDYVEKTKAKTVIDLGCAECKFVRELAKLQLKRVVGIDIQRELLTSNKFALESSFDNFYMGSDFKREQDCTIELYEGNACEIPESTLQGVDLLSCIELIEHINEEDHPGLLKTIFHDIRPKTAIITTPNGDFNSHWQTMPHGNFRHDDHRFEWSREEFKKFTEHVLSRFPEYSVKIEGIGKHWGGDYSKGFCSQSAVFTLNPYPYLPGTTTPNPERPLESSYKLVHRSVLRMFDFKSMLYDAVLQILNASHEILEPSEDRNRNAWGAPPETTKPLGATSKNGMFYQFPTGARSCNDDDVGYISQASVDHSQYELHHQHDTYHSVLECEHCPYCDHYYYPQVGPQLIHAFVVNIAPLECEHTPECEYYCYPRSGSQTALMYALG